MKRTIPLGTTIPATLMMTKAQAQGCPQTPCKNLAENNTAATRMDGYGLSGFSVITTDRAGANTW